MSDDSAGEDRGRVFFVVQLLTPSPETLQGLEHAVRTKVLANIERAVRLFRSRTLPLPGSERRLTADFNDIAVLGWELDATLRRDVEESALEPYEPPPDERPYRPGPWIALIPSGVEEPWLELRYAGDLLGKWWYRHRDQKLDLVEAVQLARELQAARDRGETGEEILKRPPKAPLPPRRL